MSLTQSQKTPSEMRIVHELIYPLLTPTLSNIRLYGIISNTQRKRIRRKSLRVKVLSVKVTLFYVLEVRRPCHTHKRLLRVKTPTFSASNKDEYRTFSFSD